MPDPITPAEIEELESIVELTKVRGWRLFKNIIQKHRIFCLESAHKHLDRHEDRKAGEWLARSKEPQKIISLLENRKKELSDKREKGE